VKRHATPKERFVTPSTGKRKRGSNLAQTPDNDNADDGELDELSPEHDIEARSVEKSRRVVGTVSRIHEEADEAPDELSFLGEGISLSLRTKARAASRDSRERTKTPVANPSVRRSNSPRVIVRKPKSVDPPITLALPLYARPQLSSASHAGPSFITPGAAPEDEDSEDELSPPQFQNATPRIEPTEQPTVSAPQEDGEMHELTSPTQPISVTPQPQTKSAKQQQKLKPSPKLIREPMELEPAPAPSRRGRPARVVGDEEVDVDKEDEMQTTPAASSLRSKRTSSVVQEEAEVQNVPDETSPAVKRITSQLPVTKVHREKSRDKAQEKEIVDISSAEESDDYEPEEEQQEPKNRAPRIAPTQKPAKPTVDEPPRKRAKFTGPKQAISVMRIKGSTVRGISAADTTRTLLEKNIDHQINRMAQKIETSQDSERRRQIRGGLNIALAFKESLNEKLLHLQDETDTLTDNSKKRKLLKSGNLERRREIITIQNSRQEVALQMDDETADFNADKASVEARNMVSTNMFDIETAIQRGRSLAKSQGRQDEGPEIPLGMLLEMVGRDVGSAGGGGLLAGVRLFNDGLERAAGWLEGRAWISDGLFCD
jgi:hypothetical protein